MSVYETFKSDGLLPEIERRGLSLTVGHHEASGTFLPCFGNEYFPEKYLETHPEYFRLEEKCKAHAHGVQILGRGVRRPLAREAHRDKAI